MLKALAEETSWESLSAEGRIEISAWGKWMDLPDGMAEMGQNIGEVNVDFGTNFFDEPS